MKPAVSITAPQFSTSIVPVLEAARVAEDCGFDGLFLFDHLVPLGDARRPVLELAATIGAVAATAERLSVGTLVLRAPLRGPEISAALANTVAMIAPGRVVIGVGAGDSSSADEARRYGQVVTSLDERVSAVERTVKLVADSGAVCWVGGTHPKVLEVAMQADGWNGWDLSNDRLAEITARLHGERPGLVISWGGSVIVGRDREDLDIILAERGGTGASVVGTIDEVVGTLTRIVAAGASHLVISVLPNRRERLELFAEAVLPRLG